jgi:predicted RNase H-like nuclease
MADFLLVLMLVIGIEYGWRARPLRPTTVNMYDRTDLAWVDEARRREDIRNVAARRNFSEHSCAQD